MTNVLAVMFAPADDPETRRIQIELAGLGDPRFLRTVVPLPFRCTDEVINAWGTRIRLRSLIAMGHNERRLGIALGVTREKVTTVANGQVIEVPAELARDVVRLWEAWWDKVPPTRTPTQKASFRRARAKAARYDWCCPLGLDEELIDDPYYIPGSGWLPATGTGIAEDPYPLGHWEAALCRSCMAVILITPASLSIMSTRVFIRGRHVRRLRGATRRAETTSRRSPQWPPTGNGRSGLTASRHGARIRVRAARSTTGSQGNEHAGQGNGGGFPAIRPRRAG
jgi:hypothetical protein